MLHLIVESRGRGHVVRVTLGHVFAADSKEVGCNHRNCGDMPHVCDAFGHEFAVANASVEKVVICGVSCVMHPFPFHF
ncbi:hypothetical protein DUNSADRAFT_8275 [Dunaliella salina]|uniref:Encoded protein n=1 Tax=Dunaliella salina TaxID=3046 RepID=A0ABQ7HA84_DUNSA|nr:hypothetical protein DUNSADRAFT_8275 [Dunaliella salina]|eukprot:KAF5843759.1 hypothetical protein DUNSADRAFT_8275 [Dunaliella salina]